MINSAETFREELTSYVEEVALDDQTLLGQKMLPVLAVKEKKGIYPKLTLKESRLGQSREDNHRAPHTAYPQVKRSSTSATYKTVDQGLRTPIDDTEISDFAKFFDMEKMETKWLTSVEMRTFEKQVANAVQDADEFDVTEATVEYAVANVETVDFVLDLDRALRGLKKYGVSPGQCSVVLTAELFDFVIKKSTKLQDYLFARTETRDTRLITSQTLKDAFRVKEVFLAESYLDVSTKKDTVDMQPCWSPGHIFVGVVRGGEFSAGGIGRTLVWEREVPQGTGGGLYRIDTYKIRETKTNWIEISSHRECHISNQRQGALIETGATNADLMAA